MIPDVGALAPVLALAAFALAAVAYRAEPPVIALLFVSGGAGAVLAAGRGVRARELLRALGVTPNAVKGA
jgi:ABC-type hemin transport system substrate-binding protein